MPRNSYKCNVCGLLKKGHTCPGVRVDLLIKKTFDEEARLSLKQKFNKRLAVSETSSSSISPESPEELPCKVEETFDRILQGDDGLELSAFGDSIAWESLIDTGAPKTQCIDDVVAKEQSTNAQTLETTNRDEDWDPHRDEEVFDEDWFALVEL